MDGPGIYTLPVLLDSYPHKSFHGVVYKEGREMREGDMVILVENQLKSSPPGDFSANPLTSWTIDANPEETQISRAFQGRPRVFIPPSHPNIFIGQPKIFAPWNAVTLVYMYLPDRRDHQWILISDYDELRRKE